MSRIICITGMFDIEDRNGYKTGKKELLVLHGVNEDTGCSIVLPREHPAKLGAVFDAQLGEYVLN